MTFIYLSTRSFLSCLMFILMFSFPSFSQAAEENPEETGRYYATLTRNLVQDGFDPGVIQSLYSRDDLVFDTRGAGLFFIHNEAVLDYEPFANKTSILLAQRYITKHADHLDKIEKKFGVDKTVITAIILVETGFGSYVGKRPVICTLSTLAALSDPVARDALWASLDNERRMPREDFIKKAELKSAWAYKELVAFIRYVNREKLDPLSVNGSYAGAMGIPQFMPSNILFLAEDGNADGIIDMFDHADAIASIANYLKHHGWRADLDHEKAQEVLFAYNHSDPYVTILMRISKLLKGENG